MLAWPGYGHSDVMNRPRAIAMFLTPAEVLKGQYESAREGLMFYERVKADAFRFDAARHAYVAAHLLVRRATSLLTGLRAEDFILEQRCPDCGGPRGPPVFVGLDGVHVSLSHSDGVVSAIAGPSQVTIDVEAWSNLRVDELLRARVFSVSESRVIAQLNACEQLSAAARLWVNKECMVKLGC